MAVITKTPVKVHKLGNYVLGQWVEGSGTGTPLYNAVTGEELARATTEGLDFKALLEYGRKTGGPALRKMTFHERGRMLKKLALYLGEKKNIFYDLSWATGATKTDSWIDIEGGIGNLFVYASKARRELPDLPHYVDGKPEAISRGGTFAGHHICVPLEGCAVHINAFNFPCWGMLEKIAVNLIAGVPAIVKPATITSYLTELMVREIVRSGILPNGSLQLICGSVGDLFEHLSFQDAVTFTGSATTGRKLKAHPAIIDNAVRFTMEADSLNFSLLGPDVKPDMDEYKLFLKEVSREITVKAGQKCTAIRRVIVPENSMEEVINGLVEMLSRIRVGDPRMEEVKMGPLAARQQVDEVTEKVRELCRSSNLVLGGNADFEVIGSDCQRESFMPITLLRCDEPFKTSGPHDIEAFGPVSTVMPYKSTEEAIELSKMGKGSLCGSVFTTEDSFAREIAMGTASHHGRLVFINRDCAKESTGHGSPLPHLIHGGPGRAGGGEEMGGVRGVLHYMQRTAIQGSPTTLTAIIGVYQPGSKLKPCNIHPFRKYFEELEIGETLITHRRTVTEADIVQFANVSWDHFYAHTDITSLSESIFEQRVAHGYFIMSAAAGLFVNPGAGPVVANYGIDEVRFTKPVYPGTTIYVKLTVKEKTWREQRESDKFPTGEVKWYVEVLDEKDEAVAAGTILTLVRRKE